MKQWYGPFVVVILICIIALAAIHASNMWRINTKCDFITELNQLQKELDVSLPGDRDALIGMVAEYNIRLAVYKTRGDMAEVPFVTVALWR